MTALLGGANFSKSFWKRVISCFMAGVVAFVSLEIMGLNSEFRSIFAVGDGCFFQGLNVKISPPPAIKINVVKIINRCLFEGRSPFTRLCMDFFV